MSHRALGITLIVGGIIGVTASLRLLLSPDSTNTDSIDTTRTVLSGRDVQNTGNNSHPGLVSGSQYSESPQQITGQVNLEGHNDGINEPLYQGTNTEPTSGQNTVVTSQFTLVYPAWLYDTGFATLDDTYTGISYYSIESIDAYNDIITTQGIRTGDLIMLPIDIIDKVMPHAQHITFSENIAPFFHPVFVPFVDQDTYTFVPIAIDPLTTYAQEHTTLPNTLTLQHIYSYMLLREKPKQLSVPVLFGFSKNDRRLLQQHKESFPNYRTILYTLIQQAVTASGNTNTLQILQDFVTSKLPYARDYTNIVQLQQTLARRNPACMTYPTICLMAYGFGDIRLGLLSDQSIQQYHFTDATADDIRVYPFPHTTTYPVRGRGFVIPTNATNTQAAQNYIINYIRAGTIDSISIQKNMISAFNTVRTIQKKGQPQWTSLFATDHLWFAISGYDKQGDWLTHEQTIKFLQGDISPTVYKNTLDQ